MDAISSAFIFGQYNFLPSRRSHRGKQLLNREVRLLTRVCLLLSVGL